MTSSIRAWALACSLAAVLIPGAAVAEEYLCPRDGLPHCASVLKPGNWINVIFLGSDTTAGAGASKPERAYPGQVMGCLRETFPGAGMGAPLVSGGAGSWWAACCAAQGQAVYGTHLPAAILLVEVAADDLDVPEEQIVSALEGLVRQVWTRSPITGLVFLYGIRREFHEAYVRNELPPAIRAHEKVAEHYGIPSVNVGLLAAQKIASDKITFELLSADGKHPTDRGHAFYAEALKPLLIQSKPVSAAESKAPRRMLPKPLSTSPMLKAQCVPYEVASLEGAWQTGQASPIATFRHVLTSDTPGATLTLRFRGAGIGIFEAVGPDTGNLEYSVDGGSWQNGSSFDAQCARDVASRSRLLARGLDPSESHEFRLRVADKQPEGSKGRFARIGCLLVDGDVPDPDAGKTPLARLDAQYGAMKPLEYTPPADRWQLLPRTMQRLREGGTLKIVLLGDSIMNQTCHSGFDLLLERLYPKVKIEKVASVRGSTGCWWYKDENRVEDYVLKHKPDLLMIGGISQRNDVNSIREVIHQIRAKQQPEILLLTPAFGFQQSDFIVNWTYAIQPDGEDYRAALLRLAKEEKCEFLDMTGPWWQYVRKSGKDYGWFRGDAVHANGRGSQILARILERYFAP